MLSGKKVDEAKGFEWPAIEPKHAGRVVWALKPMMSVTTSVTEPWGVGSVYVMTLKLEDDAAPQFKVRWFLLVMLIRA